jgi:hypothetical protein
MNNFTTLGATEAYLRHEIDLATVIKAAEDEGELGDRAITNLLLFDIALTLDIIASAATPDA